MNKKWILGIVIGALAFITVILADSLVETNKAGHFQIKQAAVTGDMSVRFQEGMYTQWFGDIKTYNNVATLAFGENETTEEASLKLAAIPVIFNDGSKGTISGLVRIHLPRSEQAALDLRREYSGGYSHFLESGALPIVRNAIKLAANLRSAQDAYTTLALFQQSVVDQLQNGMYVTRSEVKIVTRETGDQEEFKVTIIDLDEFGNPKRLPNKFDDLACTIEECVIYVPDFDDKVEEMISKRKDEAMKTELAKQAALRAKQDAITAEEQGKANVAEAKYEKEVEKVKAVTDASKVFEVAEFKALTALETAKKVRAEGAAAAYANKVLVSAGLTPQQRMEMDIKIADVISKNIANAPTPAIVISGGGDGKNPVDDVLSLFGAERALELVKKVDIMAASKSK